MGKKQEEIEKEDLNLDEKNISEESQTEELNKDEYIAKLNDDLNEQKKNK